MISAMIPGPESHICKAEEYGRRADESAMLEPSRGSDAQPLRQPGTETPGDTMKTDSRAVPPTTDAPTHVLQLGEIGTLWNIPHGNSCVLLLLPTLLRRLSVQNR